MVFIEEFLFQVVFGIVEELLNDEIVLVFFEYRVNVIKNEFIILYNFSFIVIDVLGNYIFVEFFDFCNLFKDNLFQKKVFEIIVFLLGYNNDMFCRKILVVVVVFFIIVEEWMVKFGF